MKRLFISLTCSFLTGLLLAFAWQWFQKESPLSHQAQALLASPPPVDSSVAKRLKESEASTTAQEAVPTKSTEIEVLLRFLSEKSGSELSYFLRDHSLKDHLSHPKVLEILRKRFAQSYPSDRGQHHDPRFFKEAISRLTLLQALEKFNEARAENRDEKWIGFYRDILLNPKEEWLVKRQAYRNVGRWAAFLSETERADLIRKTDRRSIATAALSDQELALKMVTDASK